MDIFRKAIAGGFVAMATGNGLRLAEVQHWSKTILLGNDYIDVGYGVHWNDRAIGGGEIIWLKQGKSARERQTRDEREGTNEGSRRAVVNSRLIGT